MTVSDILQSQTQFAAPINNIFSGENDTHTEKQEGGVNGPTFADTLNSFVQDVNKMQKDSAQVSERFVKGEAVDIHDVMITAEKAKTSFQLLMELRNKGLDLYREALRVQV